MNSTSKTIEELICALAASSASTGYTLATAIAILFLFLLKFIFELLQKKLNERAQLDPAVQNT